MLAMSASRNAGPTIQIRFGTANLANAKRGPLAPGFPECIAFFSSLILLVAANGQNNQVAIANQRLAFLRTRRLIAADSSPTAASLFIGPANK
jgi:hypothetical protein